jgi:uncharacterized protein (DUF2062 family)
MLARLHGLLQKLLLLQDSPRRIAAAFSLGVFLGFSPFVGLQILIGLGLAWLLRISPLAVFLGLNVNLPWFMIPWYGFATVLGARLTGKAISFDHLARLRGALTRSIFSTGFWQEARVALEPILSGYLLGSLLGAATLAAVAYPIALVIVRNARARRESASGSADATSRFPSGQA